MKTIWFFWLQFRHANDSAYDFDFEFSQGHKRSYDSAYGSDSVASENQPLEKKNDLSGRCPSLRQSRYQNAHPVRPAIYKQIILKQLHPLSAKSDKHQISPNIINMQSRDGLWELIKGSAKENVLVFQILPTIQ